MRSIHTLILVVFASSLACHRGRGERPVLPLQNLRLYETGIGYFERAGTIRQSEAGMNLPVPAGHLDDALKTLVVLGSDKKPLLRSIEFPSSVSEEMARSLAGLPEGDEPIDHRSLLSSLKGDDVEVVVAGERVSGRIVEVLDRPAKAAAAPAPAAPEDAHATGGGFSILFLTEDSEIRTIDESAITSVRPKDPVRLARLGTALGALTTNARAQRLMKIVAEASGPVTLGYIAETPLWRPTYRLVIDPAGSRAVLQAWALIHNDTDEDWSGVHVTLVSGRPTSFLYPLAAPRYGRRELAHPDEGLSTVPQLLRKTPDGLWNAAQEGEEGEMSGDAVGESFGIGGLGTRGAGGGLGSYGMTLGQTSSSVLEVGNLAEIAEAKGTESGALFSYALPAGVDLRSHASALIPFLQRPVEVELLAWLDGPASAAQAGARFVNSTGQTLPAGPIAAFADGGLAGEASLGRLKPAQQQILRYGIDLDVGLERKPGSAKAREEPRRLTFTEDVLEEHYLKTTEDVYVLENRSGQARTVFVGLPVVNNATVTGADRLEFDTASAKPVAVFRIEPKKKIERPMKYEEGLSRPVPLDRLTSEILAKYASSREIPEAERAAAAAAALGQKRVDETVKGIEKARADVAQLEKDLERLQGHLKAAGGKESSAAANPFTLRILSAEDRLEGLRKRAEDLEATAAAQRQAVRQALQKLSTR
jgi:hypothetical protein